MVYNGRSTRSCSRKKEGAKFAKVEDMFKSRQSGRSQASAEALSNTRTIGPDLSWDPTGPEHETQAR